MHCSNCGNEIKNDEKFCSSCGTPIKKEQSEGLGIASMVLGIISLVFCIFLNILTLPLSLTGLILGIVNKAKKGKRISGIILNSISIILSIVIFIFIIFLGITIIGSVFSDPDIRDRINNFYNELERNSSSNYVEGTYNCKSFSGSGEGSNYIVRLELNDNYTFLWGKYNDTKDNYVNGTYTFEDLDKKNGSGDYSYYSITLYHDNFYENGIKKNTSDKSEYEFGITKKNNKKQGIIMNAKTYNMYYCYEE